MIDVVKNSQVKDFVDFLKGGNMVVVNGRKGRDAYTCVSGKGCSVVDYCLVENEKIAVAIDSVHRSSRRESHGEIMAEEVYIANGSHPSTRS